MFHKPRSISATRGANIALIESPDAFVELYEDAMKQMRQEAHRRGLEVDETAVVVSVHVEGWVQ